MQMATIVKRNLVHAHNQRIKLPCANDKLENFVIIWKKDSGILAIGEKSVDRKDARIKIEISINGNRLVISLSNFSDKGEYTCKLSALKNVELKK
jgi:hypothetical protein